MSAFENSSAASEKGDTQATPFVTKIGSVTVTHTKPSSEPQADFEYCQPCDPPATNEQTSDDSEDEKEEKEVKVAPVDRIITPKDVTTIDDNDDYVYVVGTQGNKVTRLHNLENMTKLKVV